MPSGAKKRKAAKKKKEQQANNNSNSSSSINDTNNPQGSDDPKSQDERESDGGELGSPASQDHHNQQDSFNENEESEKKGSSSSFVSDYKPVEGVTRDTEGSQKVEEYDAFVKIERELNSVQDVESKDVAVEHVDSAKESNDGDGKSSSSSSSSDDESHAFDKKWKEECSNPALDAASCNNVKKVFPEEVTLVSVIENPPKEANVNSVVETGSTVDLAAAVVPVSEVAKHVMAGAEIQNSEVLDVVEAGLKENEDKLLPKSDDTIAIHVPEKTEDLVIPIVDENIGASANVVFSNGNRSEDKILTSSGNTESIYAENIKASETSDGTVIANEDKMMASSRAYTSEASNDADNAKDPGTSECTETQPLVPPAPQVAHRTSWTSCCGLFEVFTGSNR